MNSFFIKTASSSGFQLLKSIFNWDFLLEAYRKFKICSSGVLILKSFTSSNYIIAIERFLIEVTVASHYFPLTFKVMFYLIKRMI